MQFNLKEILHLYYLQEQNIYGRLFAHYDEYGDQKIDSEKTFGNFIGPYKLPLQENSGKDYKYPLAVMRFKNETGFYKIQVHLVRDALVEQIPLLREISAPPVEQIRPMNKDVGLGNAAEILNWASEQAKIFEPVYDLKSVDETISATNASVQKLLSIRENFTDYMQERGFGPQQSQP